MADSVAYPVAYSVGATTYVVYPDGYGTERGIAVFASNNDWASSNKFYICQQYSPNWIFSPDLTRSDGVVSFLYENSNDAAFGVTNEFVPITATGVTLPDYDRLTIVDCVPSSVDGLLKGLPSSITGENEIISKAVGIALPSGSLGGGFMGWTTSIPIVVTIANANGASPPVEPAFWTKAGV